MTKITYGPGSIEVSGHAPQAVVCHGISAICQMVANHVEKYNWGKVKRDEAYLLIYDVPEVYLYESLVIAMTHGLEDIDAEYPGNIKFEYV